MQTERRVAANPQTKPTDLDCVPDTKRYEFVTFILIDNYIIY